MSVGLQLGAPVLRPPLRPTPRPSPGASAGWLRDAPFDLTLIVGITLLAFAMAGTAAVAPRLFLPLLTLHVWLFSFDHVFATYTKLAGLPDDRRRNRFLIFYLPPLVLAGTVATGVGLGFWALNTVYFFWQVHHTARQSWGIAQRYRHRAGGLAWDDPRTAELTLWSVPVWGLLHRCHQQPAQFLYADVWMPRVPLWLVQAAGVATLLLLGHWVVTRVLAWRRGELSVAHTLFMVAHFVVFYAGYVAIGDVNAGWLLVNVWHNVQYLAYVWLHNRERFAGGPRDDAPLALVAEPARLPAGRPPTSPPCWPSRRRSTTCSTASAIASTPRWPAG